MGMDSLEFDEGGVLNLSFEKSGVLGLELLGESPEQEVLVYLRRPLSFPDASVYRRILRMCHYEEMPEPATQVALQADGQVVAAHRMAAEDFQVPQLERVIAHLDRLQN